ncbi:MAG: diguanylate cyclase [Longimicrobiales bacterium]|nr:diguanylate cyclase [Longimicrobiales bacterium]
MTQEGSPRPLPPQALLLSLAAMAVPVVSAFNAPAWMEGDVELLMWLTALLPAFVLTYYKGWRGVSVALAGGMLILTATQIVLLLQGTEEFNWRLLLGVLVVFVAVSLGLGYFAELLDRERARAESRALTDSLTSLPNRRHAAVFLEAAFSACVRGQSLSVVLFDLDHFKLFNDTQGHRTGDEVLSVFGSVLRTSTRRMDLSARYGGEEFISILVACGSEEAQGFAERVLQGIRSAEAPWGRVTASAGVASYEAGMGTPDLLVAAADRALYRAKESGRDRVVVWKTVAEASMKQPGTPSTIARAGHRPGAVVVVDDDPDVARAVGRVVKDLGYPTQVFTDPMAALAFLEQPAREVSLLLVDVMMPAMNGLALVERAFRLRPGLPVIFMSGYIHGKVTWPGVPGGATGFIQKPLTRADLAAKLEETLAWAPVPGDVEPEPAAEVALTSAGIHA